MFFVQKSFAHCIFGQYLKLRSLDHCFICATTFSDCQAYLSTNKKMTLKIPIAYYVCFIGIFFRLLKTKSYLISKNER